MILGIGVGYQEKNWEWTLEKHYHHWFTNDNFVLDLARKINHDVLTRRINTSVYVNNKMYQLDSPSAILRFPELPVIDKIRMAATLASLRFNPYWKPLEKVHATKVLPQLMGKKAWEMLWEPQLVNKMGEYANDISLVWFWTRINKRTPSVAYPSGGFLRFAEHLADVIRQNKGMIAYETETTRITSSGSTAVTTKKKSGEVQTQNFDRVLVTLPSHLFTALAPELPDDYKAKVVRLRSIGAINLILRLKKPLLKNKTYWLSICEKNAPVMAIIEHTNFMDKKHYNNEHIVYVGNYAPVSHPYFSMNEQELLKAYDPVLRRVSSDYKNTILGLRAFKAPFAQPIIPTNYSQFLPSIETPMKGVYLANIEQVYPWDRGTNYAVELGEKAAKLMSNET